MHLLGRQDCLALAAALGDTPETVISVHELRRGLCHAYVAGNPSRFDAAVVQGSDLPAEPTAYGADPQAMWELLRRVEGWECVNVSSETAAALGDIMAGAMGTRVRHYGDVYHVMAEPAPPTDNVAVRQFTLADLDLLESAPAEVQGAGFGGPEGLLADGIVACAVVDGKVVGIAHTSARTRRHADIGVCTLQPWRGRGFATAAAAIVARRCQEAGQTPVWSCGQDNGASLRVAEKLGFTQVARRTYLIPQRGLFSPA